MGCAEEGSRSSSRSSSRSWLGGQATGSGMAEWRHGEERRVRDATAIPLALQQPPDSLRPCPRLRPHHLPLHPSHPRLHPAPTCPSFANLALFASARCRVHAPASAGPTCTPSPPAANAPPACSNILPQHAAASCLANQLLDKPVLVSSFISSLSPTLLRPIRKLHQLPQAAPGSRASILFSLPCIRSRVLGPIAP